MFKWKDQSQVKKQLKSKEKLYNNKKHHSPHLSVRSVVWAFTSAASVSCAPVVCFVPAACCLFGSAWRTAWCWSRQSLPPPCTAVLTPPSSADSLAAEEWPRPAGAPSLPRHCAAAETDNTSGRRKILIFTFYTIDPHFSMNSVKVLKELFKPCLTEVSHFI